MMLTLLEGALEGVTVRSTSTRSSRNIHTYTPFRCIESQRVAAGIRRISFVSQD